METKFQINLNRYECFDDHCHAPAVFLAMWKVSSEWSQDSGELKAPWLNLTAVAMLLISQKPLTEVIVDSLKKTLYHS